MSAQEQRGVFLAISLACYPLRDCLMSSRDCVMELTSNCTGHFRDSGVLCNTGLVPKNTVKAFRRTSWNDNEM